MTPGGSAQINAPAGDTYNLRVNGTGLGSFHLIVTGFDENLQVKQRYILPGIAGPGSVSTYYVESSGGTIQAPALIATYSSALADVTNAFALGLIDNSGIATSLSQKLSAAQNANRTSRNNILDAFINEINAQENSHVVGIAPQVLINDAYSLMSQ